MALTVVGGCPVHCGVCTARLRRQGHPVQLPVLGKAFPMGVLSWHDHHRKNVDPDTGQQWPAVRQAKVDLDRRYRLRCRSGRKCGLWLSAEPSAVAAAWDAAYKHRWEHLLLLPDGDFTGPAFEPVIVPPAPPVVPSQISGKTSAASGRSSTA
ncbi:MAG: hypothetical protein ACR2HQ_06640 [Ilumatobacteraceae bacterium]